jgi:hypothetical protein
VFRAELTAVDEPAACHSPKREPRPSASTLKRAGVSGTLRASASSELFFVMRAPHEQCLGPPKVPYGTSGTNSPYGIRSWKCFSTAVSPLGIEIASASPSRSQANISRCGRRSETTGSSNVVSRINGRGIGKNTSPNSREDHRREQGDAACRDRRFNNRYQDSQMEGR